MIIERKTMKSIKANLVEYMKNPQGITFAIVTKKDDGFILATRINQPCYGELCFYGEHSRNLPEVRKPYDLRDPFPEGEPIGVYVPLQSSSNKKAYFDLVTTLLNTAYRNLLGHVTMYEGFEGTESDVIHLHDTSIEPTLFLSFITVVSTLRYQSILSPVEGLSETEELIFRLFGRRKSVAEPLYTLHNPISEYYVDTSVNLSDFLNGRNSPMTEGTLRERYSYDRKKLSLTFHTGEEGVKINFPNYPLLSHYGSLDSLKLKLKELAQCI